MLELRSQYVAAFGALPLVALAAPHDGEFGPEEVARLGAAKTPAVYVACLGVAQEYEDSGPAAAVLRWAAMVIARAPDAVREEKASAGDVAALVALRIVRELRVTAFGASLELAGNVRARNLFGADAARRGYRLWAVTWTAPTTLEPEDLDPELHPFLALHTAYDFGPADETVDLEAIIEPEHDDRPPDDDEDEEP